MKEWTVEERLMVWDAISDMVRQRIAASESGRLSLHKPIKEGPPRNGFKTRRPTGELILHLHMQGPREQSDVQTQTA